MPEFPMVQLKTVRVCYSDDLKMVFFVEEDHRVSSLWARFTNAEYRLMRLLLTGEAYTDEELLAALHVTHLFDEERLLKRNVDNIRSKLRPLCLNMYRVALYGYILLPEKQTQDLDQRPTRPEGEKR